MIEELRRRLARYPEGTRWSWRLHAIRYCRRLEDGRWNRLHADDRELKILNRMMWYAERRDERD